MAGHMPPQCAASCVGECSGHAGFSSAISASWGVPCWRGVRRGVLASDRLGKTPRTGTPRVHPGLINREAREGQTYAPNKRKYQRYPSGFKAKSPTNDLRQGTKPIALPPAAPMLSWRRATWGRTGGIDVSAIMVLVYTTVRPSDEGAHRDGRNLTKGWPYNLQQLWWP